MKEYKHTKKDVADDKILIKEFTDAFMLRFKDKINFDIFFQKNKKAVVAGCNTIVCEKPVSINSPNYKSNRSPMIWIKTNIWPCGIETVNEVTRFGRTWTIQYKLGGEYRAKFWKTWLKDSTLLKFYGYAENMQDVLDEFEEFLDVKHKHFFSTKVKQNLEYQR